jgi:quercetin dioxygenase-like cupin family protein
MLVIAETEARTVRTPTAEMAALAAPSQGSAELSTWRVRTPAGSESPVHVIDHDQVWMPVAGTFSFTVDGEHVDVRAGQAIVVLANTTRQFRTADAPAEALVAMRAGGQARLPGSDATQAIPWAV